MLLCRPRASSGRAFGDVAIGAAAGTGYVVRDRDVRFVPRDDVIDVPARAPPDLMASPEYESSFAHRLRCGFGRTSRPLARMDARCCAGHVAICWRQRP